MSALLVDRPHPATVVITLNRPEQLNAITNEMLGGLLSILDELESDRSCRCIVITGAGRGFCSGADLGEQRDARPGTDALPPSAVMTIFQDTWTRLAPRFRRQRQPIITAVNGPCVGAGFVMALAADIRVAAPEASFRDGFISVGLSGCEMGLSYLLPRAVGTSRAAEIMLTGRAVTAAEADRIGLLSRLVDTADQLLPTCFEIADQIAANTPFGVWMTKDVYWAAQEMSSLENVIALESRTQLATFYEADRAEQLAARQEGRPPSYGSR